MFHYEYEKRPPSRDSRATVSRDWHTRPLPPRPEDLPAKTSVPLKVWIIASASCFAVCGALVLATIFITRLSASETYTPREMYEETRFQEPIYANYYPPPQRNVISTTTEAARTSHEEIDVDIQYPILEKLSIFKNVVGSRDKKREDKNLISKPQIHPIHDTSLHHPEKKIEKKDQAKLPDNKIPEFKPTLPDVFIDSGIQLSDGFIAGLKSNDNYEEYYNDDNLYDDYMQSNTMTNYLIEKVQELHDWITSDADFEMHEKRNSTNEFGQLLKALNESLVEGNVTIVMSKLRDMYYGDNFTESNHGRKIILTNSTNLLSFGILTLDVMLLHNIQLLAWENQETTRNKMLKDPDVFAFNALFMEPTKVEAKRNEVHTENVFAKRQNRIDSEDWDLGKNLLENVLDIGMSTARAAIHLGRAFKNTKTVLSQISNRETLNANIQSQISRNIDANTHALHHLQTSFHKNDSSSVATTVYTDLDCVWLLYCKNLVATSKLNAPYGTMAKINGLALRMLSGDLPADRALDTLLYEAFAGWSELKCADMFPRCSKVNPATVVLDSILQPLRKSQTSNNRL